MEKYFNILVLKFYFEHSDNKLAIHRTFLVSILSDLFKFSQLFSRLYKHSISDFFHHHKASHRIYPYKMRSKL